MGVGVGEADARRYVAVYVVLAAGVVMSCVAAPPSDHDWNSYVMSRTLWGETAPSVRVMPTTLCTDTGAARGWPSTFTCSPVGLVVTVRCTVRGFTSR